MRWISRGNLLGLMGLGAMAATPAAAATVFDGGTIFVTPNVLTSSSPSAFSGLVDGGVGERWMFDRRINDWVYGNVFIFNTTFTDGLTSEVNVNMEFSLDKARDLAGYYAEVLGELPSVLRTKMDSVSIQDGVEPFGGGNDNVLIHIGQGKLYEADGILEETFVHELTHTSLDPVYGSSTGWLDAQKADPMFISPYAEMFPEREDMAETFLMWLADRYRPDSLTSAQRTAIQNGIPNRLAFFDRQNFNLFPFLSAVPEPSTWLMMIVGFGFVGAATRRRANVRVHFA